MVADTSQPQAADLPNTVEPDSPLHLALNAIEELKAESIKILDIAQLTTIADHMLICTGRSGRHVKRMGETVIANAKKAGLSPHVEGMEQSEWVLIDLNGVLVHIMQPTTRAYYQIEKLWDVDIVTPDTENTAARH
ncbi:ribosome silencing factor [Salinisphaera sp. SPP-AMP-43]|uniref:ribosome silencing factor n=1 Tax=Salinisphaera sp. SPP-AMP-43 TaxID=3121288 RepID=UPI003C6DFCBD